MGYTNYFHTKNRKEINEVDFQNFMSETYKAVEILMQKGYKFLDDRINEKYKDIVDFKVKNQNEIWLNGVGDDGHETFLIDFKDSWEFCKTARKPYDLAVKVILILAEKHNILKEKFSFDGDKNDIEFKDAEAFIKEFLWVAF